MLEPRNNKALINAQNEAKNLAYSKVLDRAQKDLFYLAKYILDYDLMTENTHQELCNLTKSLLPKYPLK